MTPNGFFAVNICDPGKPDSERALPLPLDTIKRRVDNFASFTKAKDDNIKDLGNSVL